MAMWAIGNAASQNAQAGPGIQAILAIRSCRRSGPLSACLSQSKFKHSLKRVDLRQANLEADGIIPEAIGLLAGTRPAGFGHGASSLC
eukprot:6180242-Pleurochrysis_carterae.AAC.1